MPFMNLKGAGEMKTKPRFPTGRPPGIAQPKGPERIRRKIPVIYDSVLKRALAGDADAARLALEIVGELPPSKKADKDIENLVAQLRKMAGVVA
jgi:hypothetical protein